MRLPRKMLNVSSESEECADPLLCLPTSLKPLLRSETVGERYVNIGRC
ncbi:hypothetical protein Enr8_18100 [Blastopirellula retiformator]|uniref:Uncharacterized protein n=1 Tax=Blastopirellula retiformator TaxID=2527970 RepID=A0A5C5V9J7_9BACT|nr:hypothetical protein Enr8_18100 [Blastopirellula retiformator]